MIRPAALSFLLLGAALAPAAAFAPRMSPPPRQETTIPRMSHFLEWEADGPNGLYVRGDNGRWYYARLQAPCPRVATRPAITFDASPGDRLDHFSAIRADGWRCQIASVTDSDPPPGRHRR